MNVVFSRSSSRSCDATGKCKMRKVVQILAISALSVGCVAPAHAYLDPGTGSMLLQGLIGGIAAGAAVIGLYWQRVKGYIASRKEPSTPSSEDE